MLKWDWDRMQRLCKNGWGSINCVQKGRTYATSNQSPCGKISPYYSTPISRSHLLTWLNSMVSVKGITSFEILILHLMTTGPPSPRMCVRHLSDPVRREFINRLPGTWIPLPWKLTSDYLNSRFFSSLEKRHRPISYLAARIFISICWIQNNPSRICEALLQNRHRIGMILKHMRVMAKIKWSYKKNSGGGWNKSSWGPVLPREHLAILAS